MHCDYCSSPLPPGSADLACASCQAKIDRDERDAASDAAEFNDPREQDRLSHEADLRYEYSKPEYHD